MNTQAVARHRVLLLGAHGHGRTHLDRLAALARAGTVRLAGVADVRPLDDEQRALVGDAVVGTDAEEVIRQVEPTVVVIATPMHTHVDLALLAFRAGAHVLLEKPPTPTLEAYDRLLAAQRSAGVACQVGFQAFGSAAFDELHRLVRDGALGDVTRIGIAGAWSRDEAYYSRAAWAGRRQLAGLPVMDGAMTNPFAHAIALALRLDGSEGEESVRQVEVETYRAYAIEADDTASARIISARGAQITVAVTLCASASEEPFVEVEGTEGRAVLWYTGDRLRTAAGETRHDRMDLLANLLDHIADPAVRLRVPLAECRSFMQIVEAVRISPPATPIEDRYQQLLGQGWARRRVVVGVEEAVRRCVADGRLYSELELEWATAKPFRWQPDERDA